MDNIIKWIVLLTCFYGCSSGTGHTDLNDKSASDDSTRIGNNAQPIFQKPVVPHTFQIEPGKRVGELKYATSIDAFSKIFPNKKVTDKEVYIQGKLEPEWHHFVDGLEIVWEDQSTLMHPIRVILDSRNLNGRQSSYSVEGITVGSSIQYIEFMNEASFILQRSEPGSSVWMVTNWNNGQLQKYSDVMAVQLTNDTYIPKLEEAKTINSSETWVKNTDLKVSKIIINLIDNPEDRNAKVFPSLPKPIQSYLLTHRDYFCYNPEYDEFDFKKIDLNNDNFPEYIIWFVGCPATRGNGSVFIFEGGGSHNLILSDGVSVDFDVFSIKTKKCNQSDYLDILIGRQNADGTLEANSTWYRYDKKSKKYGYLFAEN